MGDTINNTGNDIFKGFHYDKDGDGIVVVTMDMDGPVNAMNDEFKAAIAWVVDKLKAEDGLAGVVIASAKNTFFAGGDIKQMLQAQAGEEDVLFNSVSELKGHLRSIEKLPVPVVAAINGTALGGGLELCLCCDYRVALDAKGILLGFPEVSLGLLPGGGGVVRTIHMLGIEKALPLVLEGTQFNIEKGVELGLVDAAVASLEELVPAAKAWIKANPESCIKPWDKKGYAIKNGGVTDQKTVQMLSGLTAMVFAKTRGLLPAPGRILSLAHDVLVVDFDTALRLETKGLIELVLSPVAKNLMSSSFVQLNQINSGVSRPKNIEKIRVGKVGILGAGMMGQGIAYACAMSGIQTILKDVSQQAAEKGKAYTDKLLSKRVAKGRLSEEKKAGILAMIEPTDNAADLQGCDLIIEAVFENIKLKAAVTKESEPMLAPHGVFGSNTSTLPITLLSEASFQPEKFIGLHFFSPVDRMPLVEIICGKQTSDETLAKAFDFAKQIRKIPIVVNDSLGFFTSRVFGSYLDEGVRLLVEGADPVFIDNMGKSIGMPVGPLAIFDEVSLELNRKVAETQKELGLFGTVSDVTFATDIAEKLVTEFGRGGRYHGGGFYEYPSDGEKYVWPQLYDLFCRAGFDIAEQDLKDRLLFRQVIESLNCLEEGVLRSVPDGNIGSLMGIGAPAWTGGYIQFVNTYGLARFIGRCEQLEASYGERFKCPAIVLEKYASGSFFQ
ncbi:MAG: 3-hydroxyacyl-CoA dehydrogenase NAD-binding domain-containing protein [Spongiibacteraceae bacterium]